MTLTELQSALRASSEVAGDWAELPDKDVEQCIALRYIGNCLSQLAADQAFASAVLDKVNNPPAGGKR